MFDRDFAAVAPLQGVIGDPHFAARDRMGRNLALLCRVAASGWRAVPRGIAVAEATALLVTNGDSASVAGEGKVYFLQAPGLPQVCAAIHPLTNRNIGVARIATGDGFDLATWAPVGGMPYTVTADIGVVSSTQAGASAY